MDPSRIKKLKFVYLVMLVAGLISAITYGVGRALEIFFETDFPQPYDVFNRIFFTGLSVFHFAYIFCFLVAVPMLVTINKCEEICKSKTTGFPMKIFILLVILENSLGFLVTFILLYIDFMILGILHVPLLWLWELATVGIFFIIARNLPRVAGTVNVDVQEFHVRGYHVHESVFGLAFIFAAILLVFNARFSAFDVLFASFFFVFGGFLFGRDIKDVMAGKFIEKVRDKKAESENAEKRLF
ncbi:MAG: hypothetical protein Q6373_023215 [Candidatus Sigynarchaeota archaeon]